MPQQAPPSVPEAPSRPFEEWLQELVDEAHARGFSDELIATTLTGLTPIRPRRRARRVAGRVHDHVRSLLQNADYAARHSHGTPASDRTARAASPHPGDATASPSVLLAIWGLESHYGSFTGAYPVFQALATLAWQPRRAEFFRGELFNALSIVSGGYIDAKTMTGSWAGAMGQPQFMPSSYLEHAVDFDNDGLRDIWHSEADTLASIASYLKDDGGKRVSCGDAR